MSTDQSSQHPLNPGPAGHSLWMIRENLDNLPRWTFPPGYTMRPMGPGDEKLWDEIQKETEPYFTIKPGYFLEQFGDDGPEGEFIVDEQDAGLRVRAKLHGLTN